MKLKYQMRGLGIGMVVTALLMGVALKEGLPLSDAEIRARAVELGMVDSGNLSLKDVQGAKAEPTAPPASEPAAASGNDVKPDEELQPDKEGNLEGEDNPDDLETDKGESAPDDLEADEGKSASGASGTGEGELPEENADTGSESSTELGETVTVVIESGITSDQVCRRLAEAGLIENAAEFDRYLCENGYSVKIHAGTYEINMGESEEEIIRIITKSR